LFYPDDRRTLETEVDRLLHESRNTAGAPPRAMVQPHAGYRYSGSVAAFGYRRLANAEPPPRRVVILGPNHTVPLESIAVSPADLWETPLGSVEVDPELRSVARELASVEIAERPHLTEHSIEVQIPFLQRVLSNGWTLLPLVVGTVAAETTAALIDHLADPETLVIVSTDLSHYHAYAAARRIDETTVVEIVARAANAIGPRQACGYSPLRGLLTSELIAPLRTEVLDVRNSGDTAGDRHQVVGYTSIVFC
jgi:AmmeMemoRadiSam system protein B